MSIQIRTSPCSVSILLSQIRLITASPPVYSIHLDFLKRNTTFWVLIRNSKLSFSVDRRDSWLVIWHFFNCIDPLILCFRWQSSIRIRNRINIFRLFWAHYYSSMVILRRLRKPFFYNHFWLMVEPVFLIWGIWNLLRHVHKLLELFIRLDIWGEIIVPDAF